MTTLMRVRQGRCLHYPDHAKVRNEAILLPGGVFDIDDPFMRSIAVGQEHKLEPAPPDAVPTDLSKDRVLRNLRLAWEDPNPVPPVPRTEIEVNTSRAEGLLDGIQKPDERKVTVPAKA